MAAEQRADTLEDRLVGLLEGLAQLVGDRLAVVLQIADLHTQLDRLAELLPLFGRGLLQLRGCERVDLLEDARHRGEVVRPRLLDLRNDPARVAAEVGERAAEVQHGDLDQLREHVRQRQIQVDDVAVGRDLELDHYVEESAPVAVHEHAALGRSGRPRRVDEEHRVVGLDGGDAALDLGGVDIAPACTQIIE